MPTTTNYGFYSPPLTGVTPNVPRDNKTLADAIDVSLKAEETARIAADAMVSSSRTHGAGTSLTNNTWTSIPFDTNELNEIPWTASTSNFWTVPTDGYYQINAGAVFNSNATGIRFIRIWKNGATAVANVSAPAGSSTVGPSVSRGVKLVAGDTIAIQVLQTSGGALALSTAGAYVYGDITRVGR